MFRSNLTDAAYLRDEQYRTDANLQARMALHAQFSTNPQPWHQWVFAQLDLPADAQVLEVGCGPARLWSENRAAVPAGWRLTLTDFSAGMLAAAQAALADWPAPIIWRECDVQALPFADGQFDAVIANHMLYHVPDRAQALRELRRVLKVGGRLYAATNGRDNLAGLNELVQEFDPALEFMSAADQPFPLEVAAAEIGAHFEQVTVADYHNSLHITAAAPLVDYLLSATLRAALGPTRVPAFAAFIATAVARGPVDIAKHAGLVIAERS